MCSTRKDASPVAGKRCDRLGPAVAPARYRCAACGNRTRFDVTSSRRTRAFHHYSLGGDLTVEEEEVLTETVEEVSCRWCGSGSAVEQLAEAPWRAIG